MFPVKILGLFADRLRSNVYYRFIVKVACFAQDGLLIAELSATEDARTAADSFFCDRPKSAFIPSAIASAHDVLAQNTTEEYKIQTRNLSL